jgi:hypothetical protein
LPVDGVLALDRDVVRLHQCEPERGHVLVSAAGPVERVEPDPRAGLRGPVTDDGA